MCRVVKALNVIYDPNGYGKDIAVKCAHGKVKRPRAVESSILCGNSCVALALPSKLLSSL